MAEDKIGTGVFGKIRNAWAGNATIAPLGETVGKAYGIYNIVRAVFVVFSNPLVGLGEFVLGVGLLGLKGIGKKTVNAMEYLKGYSKEEIEMNPLAAAVMEQVGKSGKSIRRAMICFLASILLKMGGCVLGDIAPETQDKMHERKEQQENGTLRSGASNNVTARNGQKEHLEKMEILEKRKAAFEKFVRMRYPQKPQVQRMQRQIV